MNTSYSQFRRHNFYWFKHSLISVVLVILVVGSFVTPETIRATNPGAALARFTLVGNPNFDASQLSPDMQLWYARLWAAIRGGQTTPNPAAAAASGDLYQLTRTLNPHITALLAAFRVTGDLALLDEIDRLMEIARSQLQDYNGDGYLNWRYLYDPKSGDYQRDTAALEEMPTHAMVAAVAYALKLNAPFNPIYGQHADFWTVYLLNHFLPKWAARGGLDKSLAHPYAQYMRMWVYLAQLTGNGAFMAEATRRAEVLHSMMAERSTANGVAFAWDHRVPGMGAGSWGCQPSEYGLTTVGAFQDLAFEGFSRYADDAYMAHYAATFRDLVLVYGTDQQAGDVCGAGKSRLSFIESAGPGLAVWDSTGQLAAWNVQAYARYEQAETPTRIFIPAYMLVTLAVQPAAAIEPAAAAEQFAAAGDLAPMALATAPSARVTDGLQVLYTFDEGSDATVRDVSGVGAPLDLTINNLAGVSWQPGKLVIHAPTLIASSQAASKVISAARATNAITIEAWVKPANTTQYGPARIVTLSQNTQLRNFTLGQGRTSSPGNFYDIRLRTTTRTTNGKPSLASPAGTLTTGLTHVVYTRDASGTARIYINGTQVKRGTVDGNFSNWDTSFRLGLAAELNGEKPWLGEYYLVAVYARALSAAEVSQNTAAGPDGASGPAPTATPLPPTAAPTATYTPTPLPTNTPVPPSTGTRVPLDTPRPTNTPLPTNTPAPTATRTPVPTVTHTPVPTATRTPVPTAASATPVPSAAFFYGPQSPFNQRVPANAVYTRETRIGTIRPGYSGWSSPIYRVPVGETHPLVRVVNTYSGRVENWPIPTYAIPAPEDDHHMAVVYAHNNIVYEFWEARWVSATQISAGGMASFPLNGTGISDPPYYRVTAAGFATTAGMVVREDFQDPTTGQLDPSRMINHALTITLPFDLVTKDAFVAPAVGGETMGRAGSNGVPIGAYFALPKTMNPDSLNVHPFTRSFLWAAREYGMYVIDTSGATPYNGLFVAGFRVEPGLCDQLYGVSCDTLIPQIQREVYDVIAAHGIYRLNYDPAAMAAAQTSTALVAPDTAAASAPFTQTPVPPTATPLLTDSPVSVPVAASQVIEAENEAVIKDGQWTLYESELASGGRYLFNNTPTDTLTLMFEGTRLDIVYVQHPALGTFGVEIDGTLIQSINSYAVDTVFGARVVISSLPAGSHVLRIIPLDGTIALDAFAVEPQPAPPAPAVVEPPAPVSDQPAAPAQVEQPTLTPFPTLTPAAPVVEPTWTPLPTSTPLPVMLPFAESFDSGLGWLASGAWRLDGQTALSGASWLADTTQRGQVSWLVYGAPINLGGALYPQLSFWQKASLTAADWVIVEISLDGGWTWLALDQQSGLITDWVLRTLDLAPYRGQIIQLRFRVDTTGTVPEGALSAGYWLDNLVVQNVLPAPTPTPLLPTVAPEMPTAVPQVVPTDIPTEVPPAPAQEVPPAESDSAAGTDPALLTPTPPA